jgi:hypothetical protein
LLEAAVERLVAAVLVVIGLRLAHLVAALLLNLL